MSANKRMKAPEKLAGLFNTIVKQQGKLEDTASGLLALFKQHRVTTLDKFEALAAQAYALNGWQKGGGRPKADDETQYEPVPECIRTYMSQIRKAFKLNLKVKDFETMSQLREAVKAKSKKAKAKQVAVTQASAEEDAELSGVIVTAPLDEFTGGLWHDAINFWRHLDADGRVRFEDSLKRLMVRMSRETDIPRPAPGVHIPSHATLQ